jgi:hypothetical protein
MHDHAWTWIATLGAVHACMVIHHESPLDAVIPPKVRLMNIGDVDRAVVTRGEFRRAPIG